MGNFLQDLQYALRRLKNDPGFAVVAVLTLALGIGANSAIFSIVNAVLLRPLPYRDPSGLVLLSERTPDFPRLSVSYENYGDWRDQSHSFESVGAVRNTTVTLTGASEPERLVAQMATANIFDVLGVQPESGRKFTPEEDRGGAAGVAILSHGLWQRRFAASSQALGQAITLDNKNYTVIGVMPPGFQVLQLPAEIILPFEPWAKTLPDDRNWHPGIQPIARLKQGVSLEQARSEMTVIAKRLEEQYPTYNSGTGALVNPMQDQIVENVRPALLMLMGTVGFVLLIACTNVANLLLARAASRQREIAVRSALGARRSRIVGQLLTESILLAVAGGAVGLMLAWVAMPPLLKLAGSGLPGSNGVSVNFRVLGFTTLAALLAGILFGLAPARHAWRIDVREALNETERGGATRRLLQVRGVLVVVEIAFAMLLLVGAGLLLRSFERLSSVAPGFSTDHILIADLPLSLNAYRNPKERLAFFDRVLERSATLPGAHSAGAVSFLPGNGARPILHFNIQGHPPKSPHEFILANYRVVSSGYSKTLEIPVIQGRWIQDSDRETAPPVVVINAAMARTFFPNQNPLGQHLQLGALPEDSVPWMEVVGVVGNTRQTLATDAATEMYVPYSQADKVLPVFTLSLLVRTSGDPLTLASAVRGVVHDIDANQPVVKIRSMEQNMADSLAQPRFRTVLLAIFAGLAMVLAAVGIFSVMAYSVTQRTRELGVRIALGASNNHILQLVLGHGLRLTAAGVLFGVGAVLLLTRYMSSFLFGVRAYDPVTLVVVAGVLVAVSLWACYIPGRRATRVDPIVVLRHD